MPLRGLRRSPLTRPRKVRRDSSVHRSSWARKSGDSSSCPARAVGTTLFLIQRLEVLLHLPLEVARHLLPGDGFLHHLLVLPGDAKVLQPGGHRAAPPDHVRIEPVLLAGPRLALDADVVGRAAQPPRRIALGRAALAAPRQEPLTLGEVAVVARPLLPAAAVASALPAPLVLAPATQPLAVPALALHAPHLGQRALHGRHGLVGLPALEGIHTVEDVAAPVVGTALAPEALHLLEQLAELVRRDAGIESPAQGLGFLEDDAALALGEVALQVRQPVDLLQHADALVALLEEGVEVGRPPAQRRVLEHGREIARGARSAGADPGHQVALLDVGPPDRGAPGGAAGGGRPAR